MSKMFPRGCTIFNCDRRHGNTCCADCGYKKTCRRPCKNSPERCGLARPQATIKKKRRSTIS